MRLLRKRWPLPPEPAETKTPKKRKRVKPDGSNNRRNSGRRKRQQLHHAGAAEFYVEAMINSTDVSKWSTGTDDTRNRALAAASTAFGP